MHQTEFHLPVTGSYTACCVRFIECLVLLAGMLILLTGCARPKRDLKIAVSPSDKSLIDLASGTYDETQLLELVGLQGSMDEIHAKYPMECVRKISDTYRAAYLGDGSIAVLLFDASGDRLTGKIYSTRLLKSDFDNVKQGIQLTVRGSKSDRSGWRISIPLYRQKRCAESIFPLYERRVFDHHRI